MVEIDRNNTLKLFERYPQRQVFKEIWDVASPYQDARGDTGHASMVTQYAAILLEKEKDADPAVVIPAAILHDTGWIQIPVETRMGDVGGTLSSEDKKRARHQHQQESIKIALLILEQLNYDPILRTEILEIILQHDTRKGTLSVNESVMRDADKLWRFSSTGMQADIDRAYDPERQVPAYWLNKRANEIEKPGYFFTESAKEIAKEELSRRSQEFLSFN